MSTSTLPRTAHLIAQAQQFLIAANNGNQVTALAGLAGPLQTASCAAFIELRSRGIDFLLAEGRVFNVANHVRVVAEYVTSEMHDSCPFSFQRWLGLLADAVRRLEYLVLWHDDPGPGQPFTAAAPRKKTTWKRCSQQMRQEILEALDQAKTGVLDGKQLAKATGYDGNALRKGLAALLKESPPVLCKAKGGYQRAAPATSN